MQPATIPARSERQAMDWSLVLASQDIPTTIECSPENQWALVVEAGDQERALDAIRLYRLENRRWGWRQNLPWSDAVFHWGGLVWCILLAIIYRLSNVEFPILYKMANFDSKAVVAGEWWRTFTAMLMHADLAHLLANIATGVLLLGLAMARFGPGWGLLASYLAGACGNLAGLLLYSKSYHGLGASGMIMGALGLLSAQFIPRWRNQRYPPRDLIKGMLAGALLFVLLGTDPRTDIMAHLGGFVSGLVLGTVMATGSRRWHDNAAAQTIAYFILVGLLASSSFLALSHQ